MTRKWLLPILVFIGIFVFASQGLKGGPEIAVADAAALLKVEPRPVVIDLRERADFEQGHVPGAISVPFADFKNRLQNLNLPKTDAVILYGGGGGDDERVRESTKHLYQNGYQGGLTLRGGIDAWRAAGYAVAKPSAAPKP